MKSRGSARNRRRASDTLVKSQTGGGTVWPRVCCHPRAMTRYLPAVLLLGLTTLPTASFGQQEDPLDCVQNRKAALTTCQADGRAVCDNGFRSAVPTCFGGQSACAVACFDERAACEEGPDGRQTDCQTRCTNAERTNRQGCARRQDTTKCNLAAKLKGLRCRQRCQRAALPSLQACSSRFDGCLKDCARAATATTTTLPGN